MRTHENIEIKNRNTFVNSGIGRFGKDIDVLDTVLPLMLRFYITCLLAVASSFLIIAYTTPIFFAPISVILAIYYLIQRYDC